MKNRRPAVLIALIWASLQLICPQARTAWADVVITDPAVGATTATIDGVPATVNPDLTVQLSERVLGDGSINFSVYPQVGTNGHGPEWVAGIIPGSEWCGWGGCTVGRFGWHNVGGPLSDPSFGGLGLSVYVGREVIVTRTPASTTVRILTPPPLMRAETVEDIFQYLAAWFAGEVSEAPGEYLTRWFNQ